jgi:DNA polymerase elongation subunit (family B)
MAVLDIETNNLKADFGIMYSWAMCIPGYLSDKRGYVTISDALHKDDFKYKYGHYDYRIVKSLITVLKDLDIKWLITYYGTNFDLPYIRSKALQYNIKFPEYGTIRNIDLYYVVRNKLQLTRNSLANADGFFGLGDKTPIAKEMWIRAMTADKKAIDEIVSHNVGDVISTYKLYKKLRPYMFTPRKSI